MIRNFYIKCGIRPFSTMSSTSSAINHVVLFKFAASPEKIQAFYQGAQSLSNIEGVISVTAGEHNSQWYNGYSDRSNGFTHCLTVVVKDAAALEHYTNSDFHEQVKNNFILPCLDKSASSPAVMCLDFPNFK
jgi:hypothetical protein